jgi:hypothetical protein
MHGIYRKDRHPRHFSTQARSYSQHLELASRQILQLANIFWYLTLVGFSRLQPRGGAGLIDFAVTSRPRCDQAARWSCSRQRFAGDRVLQMACHGLLKRLPYPLETSPSPVNRDYMGASSSWSGAIHTQTEPCERVLLKQFPFQIKTPCLPANSAQPYRNPPKTRDQS